MMGLARSSYYYQPRGATPEKRQAEVEMQDRIEALALRFPRYGYRRMTVQLQREGFPVNHKSASGGRLMRESDLLVKCRRKWLSTTDSRHGFRVYPNLRQEVTPTGLNQVWVADLTYIRLRWEFIYLAVILDAFSRRVVGYALSRSLASSLTVAALEAALADRRPPSGCIHHSDRGVQYACDQYVTLLTETGMQISMSRRGNPMTTPRRRVSSRP